MNRAKYILSILEDFVHHDNSVTNDMHDMLTDESENHYDRLSPFERPASKSSVKHYSETGYLESNPYLREGKHLTPNPEKQVKIESDIHNLKNLTKHTTVHDFHSYRMSSHLNTDHLKEGDIIHDKGFTSTSLDPSLYKEIAHTNKMVPNQNVKRSVFRIHIKPGTRGHYIGDQSEFPEEKEFLLHPGTKFKVHKIHNDENGGTFAELHIHSQEE